MGGIYVMVIKWWFTLVKIITGYANELDSIDKCAYLSVVQGTQKGL